MASSHELSKLRPRHFEIIRLCHLGRSNTEIAAAVGITTPAVSMILRSTLAKAELARLKHEADLLVCNGPLRAALMSELNGFGVEALRLNRKVLNDDQKDLKLRVKIATHAIDRVIFNKDDDNEQEGGYRTILRRLTQIQQSVIGNGSVPVEDVEGELVGVDSRSLTPSVTSGHPTLSSTSSPTDELAPTSRDLESMDDD